MGHTLGLALQGRFNDPVSLLLRIVHFASATGSDLPNLPDALLVHTLAPQLHSGPAHAEPLGVSRPTVQLWRKRVHERSEEHTSELQSPCNLVCRLLLEKKKYTQTT